MNNPYSERRVKGDNGEKPKIDTRKLTLLAMLSAIVVLLQYVGSVIKLGPFSISLVLSPIVVGAALLGPLAGGWLGLVFGSVVLITGDANAFLAVNPGGAVLVVMLKGALAGAVSGLVYKALERFNKTLACLAAATVCPLVNTGVFVVGVYAFFIDLISQWGLAAGYSDATTFLFFGMITVNFFVEMLINIVLNPMIVRILRYRLES